MASQPDVVRNDPQSVVAGVDGEDSPEPVLEIISTSRLKRHPVSIEPRAPKVPPKIANVPVHETTRVVAKTEVNFRLGIKVHDGKQAVRCQK